MRATLLLALPCAVLLACGGSDSPRTGPATVTVTWGDPIAGAPVAFHRRDGSVQEVAVTDATGKATAVVGSGALVTVGRTISTDQWRLTTIAGVEPGDDLVLAEPFGVHQTGTGTVTFAGPVDGASSYRVDAACTAAYADEGYVASAPLALYGSCGGAIDAVALARAPGGDLLAYAMAAGAPITGAWPDQTASVALGAWRTDFGSLALEATNAPAGARDVTAVLEPRRAGRRFFQTASGDGAAAVPGGSASLALTYPQAFASSARLVTSVWYATPPVPDSDGAGWLAEPDAPLAARSVDLSAALLPRLSGASLSSAGGALVASWRQAVPAPALDGQILASLWVADDGQHIWTVVLPPGTTSFAFPALPPELAAHGPASGAGPTGFSVTAYDDEATAGWAAFKATRLGLLHDAPETYDLALRATQTWTPAP